MPLRKLLFPFSWLFGVITWSRNMFYDLGLLSTWHIPVKSICVGNLSTGGTGKTPHVAFLAENLSRHGKLAILSRGYGRKSKGFILVSQRHTSLEVGDEPLLYRKKFGEDVIVAVSENRKKGIHRLLQTYPDVKLILLDDAFQHRQVRAGLNILLTSYRSPFSADRLLPSGNLREGKSGKKRADLLIVTKCPDASVQSTIQWSSTLRFDEKKIHFSEFIYRDPISFGTACHEIKRVLLVTGIADSTPLIEHLEKSIDVTVHSFSDHYVFTSADIQKIHQKFDTFVKEGSAILTTEKDFMRLKEYTKEWNIENYPWFYIPISVELTKESTLFNTINEYVSTI